MVTTTAVKTPYDVWQGNGITIIHSPYNYEKYFEFEKLFDDQAIHRFFVDHWTKSFYLAAAYVLTINFLQKVMENRKPLAMRSLLFTWNTFLAIFSIMGTFRFGKEFTHSLFQEGFQSSVCYAVNPSSPAAFWALLFAVSKIAEFGDTIFLVLRKRPVIFLHWYHHAVVLVLSWHSAVELTAAGRWFICMNYFVHSIMYTYYAITSLGIRLPKILAMTVTALQTLQMLVGVAVSVVVLFLKLGGEVCQQSFDNLALSFAIYASFLVLFSSFFNNAYLAQQKRTTKKID